MPFSHAICSHCKSVLRIITLELEVAAFSSQSQVAVVWNDHLCLRRVGHRARRVWRHEAFAVTDLLKANPPKMSCLNEHKGRDRRASLAMTDIEIATVACSIAMTDSQADHHVALLLASADCLSLRTPGGLFPRAWRYGKGVWQSRFCCWVYTQGEIATVASSLAMTHRLSLRTPGVLQPRVWRHGKGVWQSHFYCWLKKKTRDRHGRKPPRDTQRARCDRSFVIGISARLSIPVMFGMAGQPWLHSYHQE